jgi:hypothetical protein
MDTELILTCALTALINLIGALAFTRQMRRRLERPWKSDQFNPVRKLCYDRL